MASDEVLPSGEQLRRQQPRIAGALVDRQFEKEPELARRYGPVGREKCLQDANYHLAYLADAMQAGDPELFNSYVGWARVMLASRGIPVEDLARHLTLMRVVIGECLGGGAAALAFEYLDTALARLPMMPAGSPTHLIASEPLAELARAYLDALLKGDRRAASEMVLAAVAAGTPVKDIYLHVFEPSQCEVGRLWQMNRLSVAQEHYCTAATQLIMSQLYPHIFAAEPTGGTMVATSVAGDLHEIGVRMVADFFEIDGWNTFYLGASTPIAAVIDTIVTRKAHVLGVSVTIAAHLRAVAQLIERVRATPDCQSVKILVGGYAFIVAPALWRQLGADGFARNAQAAITLANQLVPIEARR